MYRQEGVVELDLILPLRECRKTHSLFLRFPRHSCASRNDEVIMNDGMHSATPSTTVGYGKQPPLSLLL